jgi:hypothetical protein
MKIIFYIIITILKILTIILSVLWLIYFSTGHHIPMKTNLIFLSSITCCVTLIVVFTKKVKNL